MDPAVHVLERLGMTAYQAQAYVALVGLGPARAADIAHAADVPRTRIYSVLADLEEDGWVEVEAGRPKTFRAERPRDRLGRARNALVDQVDAVLPSLEAQYEEEATRFGGPLWLLGGPDALARRTVEMVGNARVSILLVSMFPLPCDGPELLGAVERAIDRGVRVRVFTSSEQDGRAYHRIGAEVRVGWVPPRMLFVDDRQGLMAFPLPGSGEPPGARGVWVPAPEFVEHVRPVQHHLWGMGEPLPVEGGDEELA